MHIEDKNINFLTVHNVYLDDSYLGFISYSYTLLTKLFLFFCSVITLSQERVIENLREQKEREDRVRLEEMEQMRKENQELKDKLAALQPQKLSQNQPINPSLTQNPDVEVRIE